MNIKNHFVISYVSAFIGDIKIARRRKIRNIIAYIHQHLNWSISGNLNGTNPNVFSELIWNIVGTTEMIVTVPLYKKLFLTAQYSKAFYREGSVTDMDNQEVSSPNFCVKIC